MTVSTNSAEPKLGRTPTIQERRATEQQRWEQRLQEVTEFTTTHHRSPRFKRSNIAAENDLARWLQHQRYAYATPQTPGSTGSRRSEALDTALHPLGLTWREPQRTRANPRSWHDALNGLEAFWSSNQRWPNRKRPDEKYLAEWLNTQRTKSEQLTPERRQALDAMSTRLGIPWLDLWSGHLTATHAFIQQHHRRPGHAATDPVEARLGRWLAVQLTRRKRPGALTPEQADQIDALSALLPGRMTQAERYTTHLTQMLSFIDQHQRLPRRRGVPTAEAKLNSWWAQVCRPEDRTSILDTLHQSKTT